MADEVLWRGSWIREARMQQGLQIQELADRAGVSRGAIGDVEFDRIASPGIVFLRKLAMALGIPLSVLMHERGGEEFDLGYQSAIIDMQDELTKLRRTQAENSAA